MVTGFKNTELGIIPEDWDVTLLSKIAYFQNGKAHEQFIHDKGNYVVVNSKFISTEGKIAKYTKIRLEPLMKGDIAIVMSDIPNGKALAKSFLIDKDDLYTLNQRIGALKPLNEVDTDYLNLILNRNKYFLSFDSGSGQTNLKKREIEECPIPLPPTKAEQTAIATALNDADALITQLEQLLAKKRNIKTGAMQELLRPKEGWEVKKLEEVAAIIGGGTPSTFNSAYWNGDINWFTPTEIGYKKYTSESVRKITADGLKSSSARLLPIGTILLTSRASIGDVSILTKVGCTNQGFQSLVVKGQNNNEFLYYLVLTLKPILLKNASGSTFLEISPNKLKSLEISIPEPEEQNCIAQILSDMDAEIQELENKIAKNKMVKRGMMQVLLTGKIRLV